MWDPIKVDWAEGSDAHRDALSVLVQPATTKFQYTDGVKDVSRIDPDNWSHDQALLDRRGNKDIQLGPGPSCPGGDSFVSRLLRESDMNDPHNLQRFVDAQAPVYTQVLAELRAGHKRGHWMWFIFPQIAGLGHSETARYFAIASRAEAAAYLAHPTLAPRLRECCHLATLIEGRSAQQIFGTPDDMKFRSSLTLFAAVTADNGVFTTALRKYFGGEPDGLTLARL